MHNFQDKNSRILFLDFLRGFALFGILVANLPYLAEPIFGYSEFDSELSDWARAIVSFFVVGKFFIIFSFLFGYSFGVQMDQKKSASSANEFSNWIFFRRLIGLGIFGIFHALFLYEGDILFTYAILGYILFYFQNISIKEWKATVLFFWTLSIISYFALGYLTYIDTTETSILRILSEDAIRAHLSDFGTTSNQKILELVYSFPYLALYNWPSAFLMFLVGSWAYRIKILDQPIHAVLENLRLGREKIIGIVIVAIVSNICYTISYFLSEDFVFGAIFSSFLAFGGLSLALLYCLFWKYFIETIEQKLSFRKNLKIVSKIFLRISQTFVNLVAGAGRMSLTNYIMQSLICNFIFNGWGLGFYGHLPPENYFLLAFPIYLINLSFSFLWLRYFSQGPLEFMLRKWTKIYS